MKTFKFKTNLKCNNCVAKVKSQLDITDEIQTEIMNGKSSIEIRKIALQQGYRPLVVDGIRKVIEGYTTLEELNKKLLFY